MAREGALQVFVITLVISLVVWDQVYKRFIICFPYGHDLRARSRGNL